MAKVAHRGGDKIAGEASASLPRKHHWRHFVLYPLIVLALIFISVRPMLPWAVRWYVNKTLNHNRIYEGRIGDVSLHLWRGAYTISTIRLLKRNGSVPEPFFSAKKMDLSIQWNAILHGRLVGQVTFQQPQINFVAASESSDEQFGTGASWLQTLQNLFPFQINHAEVHDGSVHFRSYVRARTVDVYLNNLEGSVRNLTNIQNQTMPLMATVDATALAMDQAKFELHVKINPFAYRPTFEISARLLGLDVTRLNDLSRTYGKFEFKQGWFDLVLAAKAQYGDLDGYVKPLFRDLRMFNPVNDIAEDDNLLQYFWQAILGGVTFAFKNQPRDQFATLIPFTGDLSQPDTDLLATIGNVLRNAFIRAYLPQLNNGTQTYDGMDFQPPPITDSTSTGDDQ